MTTSALDMLYFYLLACTTNRTLEALAPDESKHANKRQAMIALGEKRALLKRSA
jgi:hypothetical protein